MLNNRQKNHLKSLAHAQKPVVIIGNNGLSAGVLAEIDQALSHHELIKVKINAADRAERSVIITRIATTLAADFVQRVGHVATFFRRNPKTPKVALPKA